MFDSTINKHESQVVAVTRVVEKTITPDKVTEMYDKVKAEVERSIIASIKVEDNNLRGVVIQVINEHRNDTSAIITGFVLNGKEHVDRSLVQTNEPVSVEVMLKRLKDHYINVLTVEIIKVSMNTVLKDVWKK